MENRHPATVIKGPVRTVLIITALLAFSLAFQGSRGLWERDEGRYTNIALRMLQTGDFIVPTMNDHHPHFTKPPLTYWAIAGGVSLLGWNEWGARLPNALAFAATVAAVFALARRITPGRAWLPPVIYASFLFPFGAANAVTTDTLLTLWEALAILGFVEWRHRREGRHRGLYLAAMWLGFGLAFLTKGTPGLLPLLAVLAFIVLADGWRSVLKIFSVAGVLLFVVVGLGWYGLVVLKTPGLMTYFIRDEVVNRIATGMHHRNPQWYKPFVIYIPVMVLGALPWTLPLLRAARSLPGTLFSRPWWRGKLASDQWPAFLILWIVIPLMVFFASRSRLSLYILPLFVPLALATGRVTRFSMQRRGPVLLLAAWIIMLPALKLAGSFYPFDKDSREMARAIRDTVRPLPKEVVFVDDEPFWGLNLYLHCEMERVSIQGESSPGRSREKTLSAELLEREPGRIFVVYRQEAGRVIATCRQLGFGARALGKHGSWVFIAPTAELRADP